MRKETNEWSVRMLADLKPRINVDAEYQRSSVWSRAQQALLIDSILRGFDVPKIYLRKLPDGSPYLFDVIDGKQRLTAIWSFLEDELPLLKTAERFPQGGDLGGRSWSELPDPAQDRLQFSSITVSKLENASEDDIRELFLRLQKGEPLKAAETRNAIAGPIRDFVADTLARHPFWPKSGIREARLGWHEHSAIVLALAIQDGPTGVKGADLQQLYSERDFDSGGKAAERAVRVLSTLESVEDAAGEALVRNRWAVVDLAVVVMRLQRDGRPVDHDLLAGFFQEFESERLRVGRELRDLQTEVVELSTDGSGGDLTIYLPSAAPDMLAYYLAFSREGASKESVAKRADVMSERYGRFCASRNEGGE